MNGERQERPRLTKDYLRHLVVNLEEREAMQRLQEIKNRLAKLDNVPKETVYAAVLDEVLEHAVEDLRFLFDCNAG